MYFWSHRNKILFQFGMFYYISAMRILLLSFLLVALASSIQKCQWQEDYQHLHMLSYYFGYPKQGSCHYTFSKLITKNGMQNQILLFINDLEISPKSQVIISCKLSNNQSWGQCSFSLMNYFLPWKNTILNASMRMVKSQQNVSQSQFELKIEGNGQQVLDSQQQFELFIRIRNIGSNRKTIQLNFFIFVNLFYSACAFILVYKYLGELVLFPYSFFYQLILIKAIYGAITDFIRIVLEIASYKCTFLVITSCIMVFILNVFTLIYSLGRLFHHLEKDGIEFKSIDSQTNRNPEIITSQIIESRANQQVDKYKKLTRLITNKASNLRNRFAQQKLFMQRIQWLLIIMLFTFVIKFRYEILNILCQSTYFLIAPVCILLKNVNCSSELNLQPLKHKKEQTFPSRDFLLYPKQLINSYFLLNLIILNQKYQIFDIMTKRYVLQHLMILLIWILASKLIYSEVKDKLGKKVKVYKQNSHSKLLMYLWKKKENSKIIQFIFEKSEYFKMTPDLQISELICSICLEKIDLEITENIQRLARKCVLTECGHIFHGICFSQWTNNKMICPVDRYNLNQESVADAISATVDEQ